VKAARLHGARDFRFEDVPEPRDPGPGEVVIRVGSVGVCGSDLHTYEDGRIGDTVVQEPLVLGHEFAGTVTAVGPDAYDGLHQPLVVGQRVAVDPAMPCWHCDKCEEGNPNLCRNLGFMGLWPDDGALQECFIVPARGCFPIPDDMTMEVGALLEPLGVALHAADLAKLRLAKTVVVLGCGPIGLLIMRLARLSGVGRLIALDQFPWRLEAAQAWGADDVVDITKGDPVAAVRGLLDGRGPEVVIEAAWGGDAIRQAVDMADLGARLVLVGIPGDDSAFFRHSSARRKGLTLKLARRMKHVYPRALELTTAGLVDLPALVTHRFSLAQTGEAFALNVAYQDGIIKAMIEVNSE
jgi:L-iditol 2-dehydrogenase